MHTLIRFNCRAAVKLKTTADHSKTSLETHHIKKFQEKNVGKLSRYAGYQIPQPFCWGSIPTASTELSHFLFQNACVFLMQQEQCHLHARLGNSPKSFHETSWVVSKPGQRQHCLMMWYMPTTCQLIDMKLLFTLKPFSSAPVSWISDTLPKSQVTPPCSSHNCEHSIFLQPLIYCTASL